jgi:hypothetical protein
MGTVVLCPKRPFYVKRIKTTTRPLLHGIPNPVSYPMLCLENQSPELPLHLPRTLCQFFFLSIPHWSFCAPPDPALLLLMVTLYGARTLLGSFSLLQLYHLPRPVQPSSLTKTEASLCSLHKPRQHEATEVGLVTGEKPQVRTDCSSS